MRRRFSIFFWYAILFIPIIIFIVYGILLLNADPYFQFYKIKTCNTVRDLIRSPVSTSKYLLDIVYWHLYRKKQVEPVIKNGYVNKEYVRARQQSSRAGGLTVFSVYHRQYGNRYGLMDKDGKVMAEPRYDFISRPFKNGYFLIERSGRYGFVNPEGRMIADIQYDEARNFTEGYAAVRVGSKWGYIDTAGEYLFEPQFDKAGAFEGHGLARVVYDGKKRYVNKKKDILVYPQGPTLDDVESAESELSDFRMASLAYHEDPSSDNAARLYQEIIAGDFKKLNTLVVFREEYERNIRAIYSQADQGDANAIRIMFSLQKYTDGGASESLHHTIANLRFFHPEAFLRAIEGKKEYIEHLSLYAGSFHTNHIIKAIDSVAAPSVTSVKKEYLAYLRERHSDRSRISDYTKGEMNKFVQLSVTASSTLHDSMDYRPVNVYDDSYDTAWAEGVAGPGINEWIKLEGDFFQHTSTIIIANGYQKVQGNDDTEVIEEETGEIVARSMAAKEKSHRDDLWLQYNRVKKIEVGTPGNPPQEFELRDTKDLQFLELDNPAESITLTIRDVYKGLSHDDTCITEIILYPNPFSEF